ncbi:hypothetical protein [Sutcliffiella rhizosphaerae]|uniref:DUF2642 domain-containing protein n=1 Tax=Sutcliffiella rhizosphaerae TaxID=2880967 RepID=A0ABN8AI45_9BACI|nr:hypothetical protein [Sutcliffiella rhizosphaerae]CAG9622818.1 hypothetical protein BACCIP111883_03609 [Sutcliffiella rhizosphaerae]
MTFSQLLARYLNRNIEVYSSNQFFVEGVLISVGTDSFILEIRNGTYIAPTERITVFFTNVDGIRVLVAA